MERFIHRVGSHSVLLSGGLILMATGVFWVCRPLLDKGHFALLYLPVVVLAASLGGVRAGIFSAALAFFCWDFFFLKPYYTLAVADPEDWISLGVFLLAGLVMGLQTGRLREREEYALARERETALLYQLSESLVQQTALPAMATLLLRRVVEVTGTPQATLFLPDAADRLRAVYASPDLSIEQSERLVTAAQWVFDEVRAMRLPVVADLRDHASDRWPMIIRPEPSPETTFQNDLYLPLQAAGTARGVLHLGAREDGAAFGPGEEHLLLSIAHLAAALLERHRLLAAASQAEVWREADVLKSALVSSVSHELKTPLASVMAAVTGMLEGDISWDAGAARSELTEITTDLNRLNVSIGALLDLSRLEAGNWAPNLDWHDLGDILGTVFSKYRSDEQRRIQLQVPDDLPPIHVDFVQWASVMQHLVENAMAYNNPGEPVFVGAAVRPAGVEIWVEDRGPGIPPSERDLVFGKFYRGSAAPRAPAGTGLGLAIAQEIVRFHGASLRVEDAVPNGARFVITLPVAAPIG